MRMLRPSGLRVMGSSLAYSPRVMGSLMVVAGRMPGWGMSPMVTSIMGMGCCLPFVLVAINIRLALFTIPTLVVRAKREGGGPTHSRLRPLLPQPDGVGLHARSLPLRLDRLTQRAHVHHVAVRKLLECSLRQIPRGLPQSLPELASHMLRLPLLLLARALRNSGDQASVPTKLRHLHPLAVVEVRDSVDDLLLLLRQPRVAAATGIEDHRPDRVQQRLPVPAEHVVAFHRGAVERRTREELDRPLSSVGDGLVGGVLPRHTSNLGEQGGGEPLRRPGGGDHRGEVLQVVALEGVAGPHLLDRVLEVRQRGRQRVSLRGGGTRGHWLLLPR
ncbi:hypothetical protein PIS_040 [Saccharomonospora phage PIS 136]|nr:hypothetical protein PIS_040 [Saccharomonospora phage PIS 136]